MYFIWTILKWLSTIHFNTSTWVMVKERRKRWGKTKFDLNKPNHSRCAMSFRLLRDWLIYLQEIFVFLSFLLIYFRFFSYWVSSKSMTHFLQNRFIFKFQSEYFKDLNRHAFSKHNPHSSESSSSSLSLPDQQNYSTSHQTLMSCIWKEHRSFSFGKKGSKNWKK